VKVPRVKSIELLSMSLAMDITYIGDILSIGGCPVTIQKA
jgi:hypothetical protein